MKPFSDSPQDGADSVGTPKPSPQSIHDEQRREAVERSRIERLLHAKADGQISESEGSELTRLISDHARFAGEVKRTRLAIDHMSILPQSPDFAARVLDLCEDKVQFTTKPKRRSLRRERLALAACSLALIIGLVSTHRYWPGWTSSSARSGPLAKVLGAGQSDLSSTFASLANSSKLLAGEVSTRLASVPDAQVAPVLPVPPAGRSLARDTKLKLGNTSRFDKPVTGSVSTIALMASQSATPDTNHRWIASREIICADDQWLLESLSPQRLSISHAPVMSQVMSQIMARYSPHSSRFNNGWGSLSTDNQFPRDSYPHPSYSDWPMWPNLAD